MEPKNGPFDIALKASYLPAFIKLCWNPKKTHLLVELSTPTIQAKSLVSTISTINTCNQSTVCEEAQTAKSKIYCLDKILSNNSQNQRTYRTCAAAKTSLASTTKRSSSAKSLTFTKVRNNAIPGLKQFKRVSIYNSMC